MSRQIDLTKKLSEEDRAWLKERSRLDDLAENERILNDGKEAEEPEYKPPYTVAAEPFEPGTRKDPQFVQRPYGVDRAVDTPLSSGQPVVGEAAEAEQVEEVAPEDLTVDELKDELRERDLPVSGNRDDV